MSEAIGITYAVMAGLSMFVGLAVLGYRGAIIEETDEIEVPLILGVTVMVAAGWPFLLAAGLPYGTGWLISRSIDRRRTRKDLARRNQREALQSLRDTFGKHEPEWSLLDNAINESSTAPDVSRKELSPA